MASTKPEGMCEKLFNALNTNPTFRPLRRLTFNQQNPEKQSENPNSNQKPPSPTKQNLENQETTNPNNKIPLHTPTQPKPPKEKQKPTVAFRTSPTNKTDTKIPQLITPNTVPTPPKNLQKPIPTSLPAKGVEKTVADNIPTKGFENTIPIPVPPKGAMYPQPVPPTTVTGTENVVGKPKKSINEKVEDYINRTKNKMRTTTLARTQTSK